MTQESKTQESSTQETPTPVLEQGELTAAALALVGPGNPGDDGIYEPPQGALNTPTAGGRRVVMTVPS
jgi:hypothetical protein